LRIKCVHKYFAYLTLWAGFFSIGTGIFAYRTYPCNPWNPYPDFPLEYIYLSLTVIFYLGIEVAWRLKLRIEKVYGFDASKIDDIEYVDSNMSVN